MTLFTMLLVIIAERLFKLGEHWHLDHRLEVLFRRIKHFSMLRTLLMMAGVMVITFLLLRAVWTLFQRAAVGGVDPARRAVHWCGQGAFALSRVPESRLP